MSPILQSLLLLSIQSPHPQATDHRYRLSERGGISTIDYTISSSLRLRLVVDAMSKSSRVPNMVQVVTGHPITPNNELYSFTRKVHYLHLWSKGKHRVWNVSQSVIIPADPIHIWGEQVKDFAAVKEDTKSGRWIVAFGFGDGGGAFVAGLVLSRDSVVSCNEFREPLESIGYYLNKTIRKSYPIRAVSTKKGTSGRS